MPPADAFDAIVATMPAGSRVFLGASPSLRVLKIAKLM
jgi:hypothetical protein